MQEGLGRRATDPIPTARSRTVDIMQRSDAVTRIVAVCVLHQAVLVMAIAVPGVCGRVAFFEPSGVDTDAAVFVVAYCCTGCFYDDAEEGGEDGEHFR